MKFLVVMVSIVLSFAAEADQKICSTSLTIYHSITKEIPLIKGESKLNSACSLYAVGLDGSRLYKTFVLPKKTLLSTNAEDMEFHHGRNQFGVSTVTAKLTSSVYPLVISCVSYRGNGWENMAHSLHDNGIQFIDLCED